MPASCYLHPTIIRRLQAATRAKGQAMSSCKGIYVQRFESSIRSVRVEDPLGCPFSISPQLYVNREFQPPLEHLPDAEDYEALKGKPDGETEI